MKVTRNRFSPCSVAPNTKKTVGGSLGVDGWNRGRLTSKLLTRRCLGQTVLTRNGFSSDSVALNDLNSRGRAVKRRWVKQRHGYREPGAKRCETVWSLTYMGVELGFSSSSVAPDVKNAVGGLSGVDGRNRGPHLRQAQRGTLLSYNKLLAQASTFHNKDIVP